MGIAEWTPKSKISAKHLNEMIKGINAVSPLIGGAGVQVSHFSAGASIALDANNTLYFSPILGKIVSTGPDGESDYTSYKYWVQKYDNINTPTTNPISGDLDLQASAAVLNGFDEDRHIITAFNLAEYDAGSHTLAVDGSQWVIILPIRCDQGVQAASRVRYLIVSGTGGGGSTDSTGRYQGQVHQQLSDLVDGWDYPLAVSI